VEILEGKSHKSWIDKKEVVPKVYLYDCEATQATL